MNTEFRKAMDLLVKQEYVEMNLEVLADKGELDSDYVPWLLADYQDEIVRLGKKYPDSVWEIFKSGTDAEFAALVNNLAEIGGVFDGDDVRREVIRLAKSRNSDDVTEQTRVGISRSFERFWDETETGDATTVIPTVKSHTFGQVYKGA